MALITLTLIRVEVSPTLGAGIRTASATITTSWDGVGDPASTVNIVEPTALSSAELATFQVFADGLDELLADNETIIQTTP